MIRKHFAALRTACATRSPSRERGRSGSVATERIRAVTEALEGRRLMAFGPGGPLYPPIAPPYWASGTVYNDLNANGARDSGEPGLAGARVYVDFNKNGFRDGYEPMQTTSASGSYTFSGNGFAGSTYPVREIPPAGYRHTTPASRTITIGQYGGGFANGNFGNTRTVRISGSVFHDANQNGVRETSESGIAGSTVYLDANNNGKRDAGERSAVTNSAGRYTLDALPAGTHVVRSAPRLYYLSTAASPPTRTITLGSGQVANVDFGKSYVPVLNWNGLIRLNPVGF